MVAVTDQGAKSDARVSVMRTPVAGPVPVFETVIRKLAVCPGLIFEATGVFVIDRLGGKKLLVNVHVTVCPTDRLIDAGLPTPSQLPLDSQPVAAFSDTEYVPATSGPLSFDCPSLNSNPLPL